MKVACPHCQTEKEWSPENPFRPFCSERCKLIDLGEWANEGKVIPGTPSIEAFESMEEFNEDENIPPSDRLH